MGIGHAIKGLGLRHGVKLETGLEQELGLSAANEVRRGVNAVKSRSDKPKKQRRS